MKFNTPVVLIILSFFVVISYLFWDYFICIYEVAYEVNPRILYADGQSIVSIKAIPINSFGKKALFRNAPCEFEITTGNELVQILHNEPAAGVLILKSKEETGFIIVRLKSKYSLLPSEIKIEIVKNTA
jgi:hypothetical protein